MSGKLDIDALRRTLAGEEELKAAEQPKFVGVVKPAEERAGPPKARTPEEQKEVRNNFLEAGNDASVEKWMGKIAQAQKLLKSLKIENIKAAAKRKKIDYSKVRNAACEWVAGFNGAIEVLGYFWVTGGLRGINRYVPVTEDFADALGASGFNLSPLPKKALGADGKVTNKKERKIAAANGGVNPKRFLELIPAMEGLLYAQLGPPSNFRDDVKWVVFESKQERLGQIAGYYGRNGGFDAAGFMKSMTQRKAANKVLGLLKQGEPVWSTEFADYLKQKDME